MTRKEQIYEAEKRICTHVRQTNEQDYHGHFYTECSYDPIEGTGFRRGAEWADNHPINVWHDASEEPTIEQTHILATNETDIIEVFHLSEGRKYNFDGYLMDWSRVVESFNLTKWAYISDLLPKGGEG